MFTNNISLGMFLNIKVRVRDQVNLFDFLVGLHIYKISYWYSIIIDIIIYIINYKQTKQITLLCSFIITVSVFEAICQHLFEPKQQVVQFRILVACLET